MKELKDKAYGVVNQLPGFIVESGEGIERYACRHRTRACHMYHVESGEGIERLVRVHTIYGQIRPVESGEGIER